MTQLVEVLPTCCNPAILCVYVCVCVCVCVCVYMYNILHHYYASIRTSFKAGGGEVMVGEVMVGEVMVGR